MNQKLPIRLQHIVSGARRKNIAKDQMIFYEGDAPTEIYIIDSGIVKIHDIDDQGNEKILHLVNKGSILPFSFFTGEGVPTHWFYTALTDCEVYMVPFSRLTDAMRADSQLTLELMHWFSSEVHEIMTRLSSLNKTNTKDKLLAALQFLAAHHCQKRQGDWQRVDFAVTHQLLADISGITRESVAIGMKDLQAGHIARTRRLGELEINVRKIGS